MMKVVSQLKVMLNVIVSQSLMKLSKETMKYAKIGLNSIHFNNHYLGFL